MTRTPQPWQVTLWIMFVAQAVSALGFAIMFPFLSLYVHELGSVTGWSLELWAGLVFSSQAVTMALASPIWGALADRLGYKLMVERAMFGGAILITLMGLARSSEELVLLRALQGAVTGTISAANALVASITPRERMGYAMGVLQVGMWTGVAAGPLIGGMIADFAGFRTTFFITGALLLLAGVMVRLGVPQDRRPAGRPHHRGGVVAEWGKIMTAPSVGLIYALRFLSGLGQSILLPFAPLFIATLLPGSERLNTFTGLVVGLSSATGTATAIYLGRLGDRIGHRLILISCALAATLLYLPQIFISSAWQLLVLQALSGAAIGGLTPSLSALLARHTWRGAEGSVYGIDASVTSAARAAAPLVGAAAVALFGLRAVFGVCTAVFLLTMALAVLRLPRAAPLAQPAGTD